MDQQKPSEGTTTDSSDQAFQKPIQIPLSLSLENDYSPSNKTDKMSRPESPELLPKSAREDCSSMTFQECSEVDSLYLHEMKGMKSDDDETDERLDDSASVSDNQPKEGNDMHSCHKSWKHTAATVNKNETFGSDVLDGDIDPVEQYNHIQDNIQTRDEFAEVFPLYSMLRDHQEHTHHTAHLAFPTRASSFMEGDNTQLCKCSTQGSPCPHTSYNTPNQSHHHVVKTEPFPTFKCSSCDQEFIQLYDLQIHEKKHAAGKIYICSLCDKAFSTSSNLYKHIRGHTEEKPHACPVCDKAFARPSSLQVHLRVHTGEKPYACDICGRAFSAKAQLSKHIRIHTGERPFGCSLCEKAFNSSSDLRKHSRIHTGEKPFECSLCEKTFSCKVNLETHMRFHTGDKPFHCDLCDKCFMVSSQLIQHRRIHTGEKPYPCPHCDRNFASSSDRKRHLRTHSGEKPYTCSVCNRSFAQSSTMKRHVKGHYKQQVK